MHVRGPYTYPSGRCAGRAFVVITEDDGTRRQTLLSHYRMEQALGRRLSRNEIVHHKDEDPTNDALDNLEVLTYAEHAARHRVAVMTTFDCPVCGTPTTRPASRVRHNRKQGKAGPFCGKRCARRYQLSR